MWANFLAYLAANRDVLLGFAGGARRTSPWWTNVGPANFSISPTSAGPPHAGDTVNMSFLDGLGSFT